MTTTRVFWHSESDTGQPPNSCNIFYQLQKKYLLLTARWLWTLCHWPRGFTCGRGCARAVLALMTSPFGFSWSQGWSSMWSAVRCVSTISLESRYATSMRTFLVLKETLWRRWPRRGTGPCPRTVTTNWTTRATSCFSQTSCSGEQSMDQANTSSAALTIGTWTSRTRLSTICRSNPNKNGGNANSQSIMNYDFQPL